MIEDSPVVLETEIRYRNQDWDITRGLERPSGIPNGPNTRQYLDVLPSYGGQNLKQLIGAELEKNPQTSLLDIGCGAGLADIDIKKLFPQLSISVIGHPEDISRPLRDVPRGIGFHKPTKDELKDLGIAFHHVDFSKLESADFQALGRHDIIIAVYSLTWIKHPGIELLKTVWSLLKLNGTALIAPFEVKIEGSGSLFDYLRLEHGLSFELQNGGVSFRKTTENFPDVFEPTRNNNEVRIKNHSKL